MKPADAMHAQHASEPSATVRYTATMIALGLSVACALLYVHSVQVSRAEVRAAALQRQALAALAACPLPTEHEQVHIVVVQRNGALVASCMHLGARGTYRPRPRPATNS